MANAGAGFDITSIMNTGQGAPVIGDPVLALVAQINRFQKASGQPLVSGTPGVVTLDIASRALAIKLQQLTAALAVNPGDAATTTQISSIIAAQGNPVPYVQNNLVTMVQQLQAYADASLGKPLGAFQWALIGSLGLAAIVGALLLWRRHRSATAGMSGIAGDDGSKKLYSVDFEYLRDGVWRPSYDHRSMARNEEAAIRHWRQAGYGQIRNARARRLS